MLVDHRINNHTIMSASMTVIDSILDALLNL